MLREFRNGDNCLTAQTGELALQLGMTAEAERLFIECGRWDLVTRMHRALGHWDEALSVVEKHNRVRLKNTHYAYALELKNQGNIEDAIHHFVQSNTHCVEVPRMLKDSPEKLEEFVNSHPSRYHSFGLIECHRELHHWWAQSLEAKGRLKEAELYYSRVKDYVSLVRVYCCGGKEEAALELCNETGDAAACYHLARQMEAKGDVDRAIQLYTRARAFSCAVRLAKEHNRNENLYSLAQLGSPDDMLDAARHLEQRGNFVEKAVLLYHRAGHLNTAINLAFEKRQYGALVSITCDDLGSDCDPELIRKCSNFFLQNDQFVKAVEVLARGKQWLEAVKLCTDYDVALSEDLAEQLTPPPDIDMSETERRDVLTRLGYACLSQGLCHLACKKLTQAGDRVSAMKALLRSGDTNKIIFFANVSKQRDIYIMAANYLQTLGTWRNDTSVVKLIVQFYTRAKSFNSLSSFYEACAQMEVDEYQSYEKAMGALTEAYKALSRAVADAAVASDEVNGQKLEERLCSIKSQIMLCKKFVDAQLLFEDDPVDALSQCQAIVDEPKTAIIIRPGHVYAVMVKGLVAHEQYHAAYACLQEMKEKLGGHEAVARYLDKEVQNAIFRALDMPTPVQLDSRGGSDSDRGLTMGEECMESIEDNADMALESDCEYGQDDSARLRSNMVAYVPQMPAQHSTSSSRMQWKRLRIGALASFPLIGHYYLATLSNAFTGSCNHERHHQVDEQQEEDRWVASIISIISNNNYSRNSAAPRSWEKLSMPQHGTWCRSTVTQLTKWTIVDVSSNPWVSGLSPHPGTALLRSLPPPTLHVYHDPNAAVRVSCVALALHGHEPPRRQSHRSNREIHVTKSLAVEPRSIAIGFGDCGGSDDSVDQARHYNSHRTDRIFACTSITDWMPRSKCSNDKGDQFEVFGIPLVLLGVRRYGSKAGGMTCGRPAEGSTMHFGERGLPLLGRVMRGEMIAILTR
ncbi:Intraflagellar transport protein [Echinococcus granulosus]|uniref:Intraflagellar transport protein n=1 Tax=Echinococcus granulosus TaxID=6210 RepID=W6UB69_ECHGR|nr:Intraflagellar transport protein [Echinococcus granulosus]EUB58340.1 Intraflagellar transport protein [Echinococcus granulosus]